MDALVDLPLLYDHCMGDWPPRNKVWSGTGPEGSLRLWTRGDRNSLEEGRGAPGRQVRRGGKGSLLLPTPLSEDRISTISAVDGRHTVGAGGWVRGHEEQVQSKMRGKANHSTGKGAGAQGAQLLLRRLFLAPPHLLSGSESHAALSISRRGCGHERGMGGRKFCSDGRDRCGGRERKEEEVLGFRVQTLLPLLQKRS